MTERVSFYVLDITQASRPGKYVAGSCLNCENQKCPECGVWRQLPPSQGAIVLEVPNSRKSGYYAEAMRAVLPVFRRDLVDVWMSARLTGFHSLPVNLVRSKDRAPLKDAVPEYVCAVIDGRARFRKPPSVLVCPTCGFVEYDFAARTGIEVDLERWDGTDLCCAEGYSGIMLCTDRAAGATLQAGYNKAISFVRADRWGTWEPFDVRKWTAKAYRKMLEDQYLIRSPERLSDS